MSDKDLEELGRLARERIAAAQQRMKDYKPTKVNSGARSAMAKAIREGQADMRDSGHGRSTSKYYNDDGSFTDAYYGSSLQRRHQKSSQAKPVPTKLTEDDEGWVDPNYGEGWNWLRMEGEPSYLDEIRAAKAAKAKALEESKTQSEIQKHLKKVEERKEKERYREALKAGTPQSPIEALQEQFVETMKTTPTLTIPYPEEPEISSEAKGEKRVKEVWKRTRQSGDPSRQSFVGPQSPYSRQRISGNPRNYNFVGPQASSGGSSGGDEPPAEGVLFPSLGGGQLPVPVNTSVGSALDMVGDAGSNWQSFETAGSGFQDITDTLDSVNGRLATFANGLQKAYQMLAYSADYYNAQQEAGINAGMSGNQYISARKNLKRAGMSEEAAAATLRNIGSTVASALRNPDQISSTIEQMATADALGGGSGLDWGSMAQKMLRGDEQGLQDMYAKYAQDPRNKETTVNAVLGTVGAQQLASATRPVDIGKDDEVGDPNYWEEELEAVKSFTNEIDNVTESLKSLNFALAFEEAGEAADKFDAASLSLLQTDNPDTAIKSQWNSFAASLMQPVSVENIGKAVSEAFKTINVAISGEITDPNGNPVNLTTKQFDKVN